MKQEDIVIFNGQVCSKGMVITVIDKILPTVLDVVADVVIRGGTLKEAEDAAINVVTAATKAISVKSLVSPKS
ncbi:MULTISPECIES: hypothetical protein [Edwardsiella]|uniref:Uncharacterized protein n=1 Tax=Edwardsiella anguillarum TaxID=1821960 RepID=A0ABY8SG35_9GAMM|nr:MULTISPECIES: hypothetical protein [Edwardsiella]AKR76976.1 hypothetical protein AAZ33_03835 [Edwardsiella sp. LADL05-105]WHP84620.1 hypothetical protein MQ095_03880 [Edwardsiella anguillarum]WHP88403.1 hypothetical protein MQ088_03880 [Edwardsiella anguillarum]WHP92203.1 hypothetical protein MQ091_03880 [Edwardsiella anguillarum]WHP96009.1 hypothetical protein MQ096_03880 [Edwardsiella anguillarum]